MSWHGRGIVGEITMRRLTYLFLSHQSLLLCHFMNWETGGCEKQREQKPNGSREHEEKVTEKIGEFWNCHFSQQRSHNKEKNEVPQPLVHWDLIGHLFVYSILIEQLLCAGLCLQVPHPFIMLPAPSTGPDPWHTFNMYQLNLNPFRGSPSSRGDTRCGL